MAERSRRDERPMRELAARGLAAVVSRVGGPPPELAVLTYHRVAPVGSQPKLLPGLAAAVEDFDEQMAWLAAQGTAVGIDEVVAACSGGPKLRPGSVLVTFDDAYIDVAEHAWPILQRHQIPCVLFVPTGYPDASRRFWWDELHAAVAHTSKTRLDLSCGSFDLGSPSARGATFRALRAQVVARPHGEAMALVAEVLDLADAPKGPSAVLSWSALSRLAEAGMAMAPHSRTHPRLDRVAIGELADEVCGSYEDLRAQVGRVAPAFAYPGGGHGAVVRAAVADAGMAVGFTTERGVNPDVRTDPLRLARINVGSRTSLAMIRAQLSARTHAVVRAAGRGGPRPGSRSTDQPRSVQWN